MEEESHNAGMVVAIRIKPPDLEEEFSVTSQGANMLTINVSDNRATYKYDFVHWSTGLKCDTPRYASQEAVFNDVGAPLVQNALQGFNCCLFAYGQTVSIHYSAHQPHSLVYVLGIWENVHNAWG